MHATVCKVLISVIQCSLIYKLKFCAFLNEVFFFSFQGVLRFIMEAGAKGCEVVVSGKLRGQRAKAMKFVDGLMIHSGDPSRSYIDCATRHVLLRLVCNVIHRFCLL